METKLCLPVSAMVGEGGMRWGDLNQFVSVSDLILDGLGWRPVNLFETTASSQKSDKPVSMNKFRSKGLPIEISVSI
jgi:hypothetical protein